MSYTVELPSEVVVKAAKLAYKTAEVKYKLQKDKEDQELQRQEDEYKNLQKRYEVFTEFLMRQLVNSSNKRNELNQLLVVMHRDIKEN